MSQEFVKVSRTDLEEAVEYLRALRALLVRVRIPRDAVDQLLEDSVGEYQVLEPLRDGEDAGGADMVAINAESLAARLADVAETGYLDDDSRGDS